MELTDIVGETGFDNFVTKPVRQKYLHDVIAVVMGYMENLTDDPGKPVFGFDSTLRRPQSLGLVLLVEDNLVNQKVAKGMLKKLGCQVDIADNGQVACEKLKKKQYKLVLMDCQMPILDGYAATKKMRTREHELSLPHTPIVAMTANAMEGDREKCLDAGMDDYLGKPVTVSAMQAMLKKWLPLETGVASETLAVVENNATGKPEIAPHLDNNVTSEIIECLGRDAFRDIAALFIKTGKELVGSLNAAYDKRDKETLHYVAHTLKGSSGNIGARILFQLCETLDTNVKRDTALEEMQEYISKINDEFGYIVNQLKKAG